MFNKLFKSDASNNVATAQKQYPEIITEIHKEFNTAGERLLQEAIGILADCKLKDKHKGKLLARLGFINTPQAKETLEVERAEKQAEETAKLVRYYSQKYPFNKFINEITVEQICGKYNLVCGEVSLYKGFVPADKLKMIADFKISSGDCVRKAWSIGIASEYKGQESNDDGENARRYTSLFKQEIRIGKLQICAPFADMNTSGYYQSGYRMVQHIPDPIVLQPVNGGYLIVCAWGDEASDELVVNSINN